MLPLMVPLARRFDPDAVDNALSCFAGVSGFVPVAMLAPLAADGMGRATVDGTPLSGCEAVTLFGFHLLLVPVGEVAHGYGRRYRVTLEGFRARSGLPFPRCRFTVRTARRREPVTEYLVRDERALEAAREGMVLLKNDDDALPLKPDSVLNCFGPGQHAYRISTTGASWINPRWRPNFIQSVREHSRFRVNEALSAFYRHGGRGAPDADLLAEARAMGDTALVFITRRSGEMQDNRPVEGQYYLTRAERDMLRAATDTFARTVVILNTGYPIAMGWLREYPVDAVLYTGFAGMLSGYALVELLDGRANPSGHLPDTWPWDWPDNPVSRNFPVQAAGDPPLSEAARGVRIYYEEDIYLGYRYFDTFGVPVAFCFGHGLSYARFRLEASPPERAEDGARVRVTVTNLGPVPGKAVAQLYVAPPTGGLERPRRLLADFGKTRLLAPGESEALTLYARRADVAAYDEARAAWVLEVGEYGFEVGESLAEAAPCGSLARAQEAVLRRVRALGAPVEDFRRLTRANPEADGTKSGIFPLKERFAARAPRPAYRPEPLPAHRGERVLWKDVLADPDRLEAFVAQMNLLELCRLNVCGGHRWLPWLDGAAGFTQPLRRYGLPSWTVADANAGLNLKSPNIGFPASSVIAASFNRDVARTVGRTVAEESRERGVALNLGPGMNLHRSILCGRHPEYFSEDPLLTGVMAGQHAKGLEDGGVGSCMKHMFCNNSELSRKGSHSVVSERALRELYFRAFEIAFREQKPASVMTGYNALNGLYPGENADLLQGLLRDEWGFDGFVMTDWRSYATIDGVEMTKAGNGWLTPGGKLWTARLYLAARTGRVPRATLQRNALWLLGAFGRLQRQNDEEETQHAQYEGTI